MDNDWEMSDPCPKCRHWTKHRECTNLFCDHGWIDMHEQDSMWYDEGEIRQCWECQGHGSHNWCPSCGWDVLLKMYPNLNKRAATQQARTEDGGA